ncbi:MAG: peptide MFS transporter [Bernardetiaceae bacterium]|nr:peptide MFS transporter [Bernardetiaceae bacterium]
MAKSNTPEDDNAFEEQAAEQAAGGTILGHPKALFLLFFTEMWERFSYYGMRALLVLYMISETVNGGLGWSSGEAGQLYGWYTGLVYVTPILGGWLADRYLGYRSAVFIGGVLMALGHGVLAFEPLPFFFTGLGLLIIGNGFFKPNISSMVGQLYAPNSPKKDSGYTIFYMGINLGALLGSLVCGALGEFVGWHWGFGAAGVGMVLGLIQFYVGRKLLGDIGLKPKPKTAEEIQKELDEPQKLTTVEIQRLAVIGVLSVFSILFWVAFEQAGSSMNIFAYKYSDRLLFTSDYAIKEVESKRATSIDSIAMRAVAEIFNDKKNKAASSEAYDEMLKKQEFQAYRITHYALPDSFKNRQELQEMDYIKSFLAENEVSTTIDYFSPKDTTYKDLASNTPLVTKQGRFLAYNKIDSVTHTAGEFIVIRNFKEDKKALDPFLLSQIKSGPQISEENSRYYIRQVDRNNQKGFEVPATWFQSINALFIFIFAPLFAGLWIRLGKFNPNGPVKFAFGLFLLSLGFVAMVIGAASINPGDPAGNVSMLWLVLAYLLHTWGELCLSPVGLSFVNKLSPKRLVGLMFGIWFLAAAIGNYIAGALSGLIDKIAQEQSMSEFFMIFVATGAIGGLILLLLSPLLRKWMHGVK